MTAGTVASVFPPPVQLTRQHHEGGGLPDAQLPQHGVERNACGIGGPVGEIIHGEVRFAVAAVALFSQE